MTEDLVIVVVANKLDLALYQREVSCEEAQKYITRVLGPDTLLYEVSAKEDNGTIEEIFLHITRVLVDRKQYLPKKRQPTYLPMEEEPAVSKSSCCGF
ncbi:Putative Rab family, other [Rhizopus microsporus]|nr:Putative Rab family, other [Rhizopus microsporus]